jgi:rod shape determining protein RodA
MTIGVMPVTGLPLPFLSYGGSPLVMNMVLVGFLLNIHARRHEYF